MRQSETSGKVNNSSRTASDIKPQTIDKRITSYRALKAGFSETPAIFTVIVNGKDCNGKEYRISNVYEEYHPLMAIGRAVIEFRKAIIVGSIEHILVSERVISAK